MHLQLFPSIFWFTNVLSGSSCSIDAGALRDSQHELYLGSTRRWIQFNESEHHASHSVNHFFTLPFLQVAALADFLQKAACVRGLGCNSCTRF